MNQVVTGVKKLGGFCMKWAGRLTKMARHRLMTKRKNILIFAEDSSSLYQTMHPKMKHTYEITRVFTQNPPVIEETHLSTTSQAPKQTFYQEYHLNNNYQQIEQKLQGKQFDAVIVLPSQSNSTTAFDFSDEQIVGSYLDAHQQELFRNIFSYRLASKYLTTGGVVIYSASERDFLKAEPEETLKDIPSFHQKWYPGEELIDSQITFLGVVTGERDYTDLNSWSLVAMSKEWLPEEVDFVAKHYLQWTAGQKLPMPGSFCLFKRKTLKHKNNFVEYI